MCRTAHHRVPEHRGSRKRRLPVAERTATYNRPTMQTTNRPLPKSRLQLEFELPPERLSRAIDQAVGRLSRQTRVAGFRPGKAPRVMLERVLGEGAILDDALEHLVQDAYREAVIEQDLVAA